jgi:6-phosphogluconolactonase
MEREGMKVDVRVFEEVIDVWRVMASHWREIAAAAVAERGSFTVAISGGRTPLPFYCFLGRTAGIPWEETDLFQVDERFVPRDDDESNFRLIELSLLLKAPIPSERVHPIPVDGNSAAAAAARYEREMRDFFRLPAGAWPSLDLVLLGIGEDGHTASLFPGEDVLDEEERWTAAVSPATAAQDRITLTLPLINRARHVFFLVTGSGKAEVLKRIHRGADPTVPASLVNPEGGSLTFYLDSKAAAQAGV